MSQSGTEVKRFDLVVPSVVKKPHKGFLFPNGAKALVVEDSTCQLAAAAVTVRVGSNQDPVNVPGLAHFCEHMLFMGTQKYPREDEFDSFVSRNGGHTNAWTEAQGTTYYFTVSDEVFLEALDRFLEFFVAPSFNPSAVSREMEAVHSEDEKNHNVDYWRLDEIMRSLADTRHPYHRYGNGNLTTLRDVPTAMGINVRDELVAFHEAYYVADAVSVVLYTRRGGDEVLPILDQQLKRLRQRDHIPVGMNSFVPQAQDDTALPRTAPFSPAAMGRWYNVKTVKQVRSVRVFFPFPDGTSQRHKMISGYASHMLGHECDASLLGSLKKRGWATGIVAGAGGYRDDDDGVFYVEVDLTCAGFEQVAAVVELTFKAIDLLARGHYLEDDGNDVCAGLKEAAFEEMRAEHRLTFEMAELGRAEMHCAKLSSALNTSHRVEDAWLEGYVPTEVDRAASMDVIQHLTPSSSLVILLWNGFPIGGAAEAPVQAAEGAEDDEDSEEEDNTQSAGASDEQLFASLPEYARFTCTSLTQFHKAPYASQPIPQDVLSRWGAVRATRSDDLGFPPTNRFLATDFTVHVPHVSEGHALSTSDVEDTPDVFESQHGRLYVMTRSNHLLQVPKASAVVEFVSTVPYASPKHRFWTRVMALMLKHQLTELSYMGELSSINNHVVASHGGIGLTVEGPTHHLAQFLRDVTQVAVSAKDLLGTQALFDTYRESALRALRSVAMQQPYELCSDRLNRLSAKAHYAFDDILAAVDDGRVAPELAFAEYTAFVESYLSELRIEMIIAGNVASAAAAKEEYFDAVEKIVVGRHASVAKVALEQVGVPYRTSLALPIAPPPPLPPGGVFEGSTPIVVLEECAFNAADTNSSVVWEIQLGRETPELRVLADCLGNLLSSKFFNALRTQEALGYVVAARSSRTHGLCVLKLVAQSAKAGVDGWYLLSRMVGFLESAEASWDSALCSDSQLEEVIKGQLRARQEPLKKVSSFVSHVGANIHHPSGLLRRPLEIDALQAGVVVTKATLTRLFQTALSNRSSTRRSLAAMMHAQSYREAFCARSSAVASGADVANFTVDKVAQAGADTFATNVQWSLPAALPKLATEEAAEDADNDADAPLLLPQFSEGDAMLPIVYLNTNISTPTAAALFAAIGGEWVSTP